MVQRTLLNLLRLLLLGTEHQWCEDLLESAPFIRAQARKVQGPIVFVSQVKSSHLYLYSAFNNTNCNKALHNIKIGKLCQ